MGSHLIWFFVILSSILLIGGVFWRVFRHYWWIEIKIKRITEKQIPNIPLWHKISLAGILFFGSVILYLGTRLIGLEQFPIYFFTDEAIHTILAEELVNNHFQYQGVFLPIYFPFGSTFGLNSVSVYLQVIPYLIFGKSVFVTRMVSVMVGFSGVIAASLILKYFFKSKYWWSVLLVLSVTPTWFLHSRTAFEYVELAAFYVIFIFFYLCYRQVKPVYIYFSIIFAILTFYTHGLGQPLVFFTALALFVIDFKYHWINRKTILIGTGFTILLLIPYFQFYDTQPGVFFEQIRTRGSYWIDQNLDLIGKIIRFFGEYFRGLDPTFWFIQGNSKELPRHQMRGYASMLIIFLPFLLYGIWRIIQNIRYPAQRTVLIALLASPISAALAQMTTLRVIWLVFPAAIITSYGIDGILQRFSSSRLRMNAMAIGLFLILGSINLFMFWDGLVNGPTWFTDYGLYGMQYGAQQLFGDAIPALLKRYPESRVVVTPTWANGTDNFVRFFMSEEQRSRVRLDSIEAYLFNKLPVDDNLVLVLTKSEFELAASSPKFKKVNPLFVIDYPDRSPGFYFTNLAYADNADELFEADKIARAQPLEGYVMVGDQNVKIIYSRNDMGTPESIFDGDVHTLLRGLEANPYLLVLEFPEGRAISGLSADLASMDFTITISLFSNSEVDPVIYEQTYNGLQGDPHINIKFDRGPERIDKIVIKILSLNGGEQPHIHIREINLIP